MCSRAQHRRSRRRTRGLARRNYIRFLKRLSRSRNKAWWQKEGRNRAVRRAQGRRWLERRAAEEMGLALVEGESTKDLLARIEGHV